MPGRNVGDVRRICAVTKALYPRKQLGLARLRRYSRGASGDVKWAFGLDAIGCPQGFGAQAIGLGVVDELHLVGV